MYIRTYNTFFSFHTDTFTVIDGNVQFLVGTQSGDYQCFELQFENDDVVTGNLYFEVSFESVEATTNGVLNVHIEDNDLG